MSHRLPVPHPRARVADIESPCTATGDERRRRARRNSLSQRDRHLADRNARSARPLRGPAHDGRDCEATTRRVFFDGAWCDTRIVLRTSLTAGDGVEGPALVGEMESSKVVAPGRRMEVDADGEFHLRCDRGVESTA